MLQSAWKTKRSMDMTSDSGLASQDTDYTRDTLIGSRALTASPKQYRYNVVAHIPLEQPDETPATLPAR
jgi:hypothetical protein